MGMYRLSEKGPFLPDSYVQIHFEGNGASPFTLTWKLGIPENDDGGGEDAVNDDDQTDGDTEEDDGEDEGCLTLAGA